MINGLCIAPDKDANTISARSINAWGDRQPKDHDRLRRSAE
jgi:hypothetical protein